MDSAPVPRRLSASAVITFAAAAAVVWAAAGLVEPLAGVLATSPSEGVGDQRPLSAYTVTGRVFRDLDGDGLYAPGVEPGQEGWQVYADVNFNGRYDPGVEPVATTLGDRGPGRSAGSYELADIPPSAGGMACAVRLVESQPKLEGTADGDPTRWREDVPYTAPQEHAVFIPSEPQTFPHRDFVVAPLTESATESASGAVARAR